MIQLMMVMLMLMLIVDVRGGGGGDSIISNVLLLLPTTAPMVMLVNAQQQQPPPTLLGNNTTEEEEEALILAESDPPTPPTAATTENDNNNSTSPTPVLSPVGGDTTTTAAAAAAVESACVYDPAKRKEYYTEFDQTFMSASDAQISSLVVRIRDLASHNANKQQGGGGGGSGVDGTNFTDAVNALEQENAAFDDNYSVVAAIIAASNNTLTYEEVAYVSAVLDLIVFHWYLEMTMSTEEMIVCECENGLRSGFECNMAIQQLSRFIGLEQTYTSGESILFAFYIDLAIGVAAFIGFGIFWPKIMVYRARLHHPQVAVRPPPLPENNPGIYARFYNWIGPCVGCSEEWLLRSCGLDALMLDNTVWLGVSFFLLISVWNLVVLIPIHYHVGTINAATKGVSIDGGWERLTASNLGTSPAWWVHFVSCLLIVWWGTRLIRRQYAKYKVLRWAYLSCTEVEINRWRDDLHEVAEEEWGPQQQRNKVSRKKSKRHLHRTATAGGATAAALPATSSTAVATQTTTTTTTSDDDDNAHPDHEQGMRGIMSTVAERLSSSSQSRRVPRRHTWASATSTVTTNDGTAEGVVDEEAGRAAAAPPLTASIRDTTHVIGDAVERQSQELISGLKHSAKTIFNAIKHIAADEDDLTLVQPKTPRPTAPTAAEPMPDDGEEDTNNVSPSSTPLQTARTTLLPITVAEEEKKSSRDEEGDSDIDEILSESSSFASLRDDDIDDDGDGVVDILANPTGGAVLPWEHTITSKRTTTTTMTAPGVVPPPSSSAQPNGLSSTPSAAMTLRTTRDNEEMLADELRLSGGDSDIRRAKIFRRVPSVRDRQRVNTFAVGEDGVTVQPAVSVAVNAQQYVILVHNVEPAHVFRRMGLTIARHDEVKADDDGTPLTPALTTTKVPATSPMEYILKVFRRVYGDEVLRIIPVVNHKVIDILLLRWSVAYERLAIAKENLRLTGKRPMHVAHVCGTCCKERDPPAFYRKYNEQLTSSRRSSHRCEVDNSSSGVFDDSHVRVDVEAFDACQTPEEGLTFYAGRCCCCMCCHGGPAKRVDSLDYYSREVRLMEREVTFLRRRCSEEMKRGETSAFFVVFRTQMTTMMASRSYIDEHQGSLFHVSPAPSPDNVLWGNLWGNSKPITVPSAAAAASKKKKSDGDVVVDRTPDTVEEQEEEADNEGIEEEEEEAPPTTTTMLRRRRSAASSVAISLQMESAHSHNNQSARTEETDRKKKPLLIDPTRHGSRERRISFRTLICFAGVGAMVLFPVGTFTGAVTQLDTALCTTARQEDWGNKVDFYCGASNFSAFLRGVVTTWLPALLLSLWQNLVVPKTFYALAIFERRHFALSDIDVRISSWMFIWVFINVFLGTLLGSLALLELGTLLRDPGKIVYSIGSAIPRAGNFFVNYVLLRAFLVPFRLFWPHMQVLCYILQSWIRNGGLLWCGCGGGKNGRPPTCLFCLRTRRARMLSWAPKSVRYGREMGMLLMIFLICTVYATAIPLLAIMALGFFVFTWIQWRYQLLYVYMRSYESGGCELWPHVALRLVWILAIYQTFTSCLLLANRQWYAAILLWLIVPGYLYRFHLRCNEYYRKPAISLPLSIAARLPPANVRRSVYVAPALRKGANGWTEECGKVWQGWGSQKYTA